jgi:hypothetical protein
MGQFPPLSTCPNIKWKGVLQYWTHVFSKYNNYDFSLASMLIYCQYKYSVPKLITLQTYRIYINYFPCTKIVQMKLIHSAASEYGLSQVITLWLRSWHNSNWPWGVERHSHEVWNDTDRSQQNASVIQLNVTVYGAESVHREPMSSCWCWHTRALTNQSNKCILEST